MTTINIRVQLSSGIPIIQFQMFVQYMDYWFKWIILFFYQIQIKAIVGQNYC